MNTYVKVIGLTRLGVKPESTAPEADALTTRLSELMVSSMMHEKQMKTLALLTFAVDLV